MFPDDFRDSALVLSDAEGEVVVVVVGADAGAEAGEGVEAGAGAEEEVDLDLVLRYTSKMDDRVAGLMENFSWSVDDSRSMLKDSDRH